MKNKSRAVGILTFSAALLIFGCDEPLHRADYSSGASFDGPLLKAMAVRIVQAGLADNDPRIRACAIEVVAATQRVELMPNVYQLLRDDFVPVRFAAALAAGDLKYRLAERTLKQLLRDQDENVRIAAAYAMAKLGRPGSLEPIRRAVASNDGTVRANAVWLLGKSGDKSALKLLYWAMKDKDSDDKVRFQAAEAIARLGDEQIYPTLWKMLINAYAEDKIMGISAMGALGTAQARNALITMLDDDILEVRLAAAEQLGMLGDTAGEPEVLDVFTKDLTADMDMDKEGPERVNVLTALAIGQIGTAPLKKFLPQMLKNESKSVRLAAAKAVLRR